MEVVLVGVLLTLLFVGVVQLTVVLHVRNTLIDDAGEGARHAAFADGDLEAGAERARALITADLSARYAADVTAARESHDGLATVVVRVRAPLPVAGLLGAGRVLVVEGHAVDERAAVGGPP